MVDYQTRQELNALSKDVFGASSRWQKLVNNGYNKLVTEEVTELVPGETEEAEPTTRKVQVPLKRADGALQYTNERHTVESVRELMLKLKKQREDYLAAVKKSQEEQKAKQAEEALAKKVHEELSGSAGL